ncbi:MAG: hypothetical protein AAFV85_14490 [Cyanobacteria bacterium J06634_6]
MSSALDTREKAIALINQLHQDKLPAVVQLLEILAHPAEQKASIDAESGLLELIQRRLPEAEQQELNDLRHRCEWGQLTEEEQNTLIRYEDKQEVYRVDRLTALITLAKLRNLDLMSLNHQIQTATRPSNAA